MEFKYNIMHEMSEKDLKELKEALMNWDKANSICPLLLVENMLLQKLNNVFVYETYFNNKRFFIIVKKVNMFRVFYKAYNLPVSKDEFTWEESKEVLKVFNKLLPLQNVAVPSSMLELVGLNPNKKYSILRDYVYTNPTTRFNVGASKYRSKYKVNKYSDNIIYRPLSYDDFEAVLELSSLWKGEKVSRFGKFSTPEADKFITDYLWKINSENIFKLHPMGLFYKNKLVAWNLINYTPNGNAYILVEQCCNKATLPYILNDENAAELGNYIGNILFYYQCNFFSAMGAKTVCIGTRSMSGKGVQEHKEHVYKGIETLHNIKVGELCD